MIKYLSQFKSLDNLNNSAQEKQERGRLFENLFSDLFAETGILVKSSYHTADNKSEQIDSAITVDGRYILAEVKWVESGLAASELYAFAGKVENKFIGTIGLFISRNALSDNFLSSLNKGRRQCIVVLHGEDVDVLFSSDYSIAKYIAYAITQLSINNRVHIPYKEFVSYEQIKKEAETAKTSNSSGLASLIFSGEDNFNRIVEYTEVVSEFKTNQFSKYLKIYPDIVRKYSYAQDGNIVIENLLTFLKNYYNSLPDKQKALFTKEYIQLYLKEGTDSYWSDDVLVDLFNQGYEQLSLQEKRILEEDIIKHFERIRGLWDQENYLTFLVRGFFDVFESPKDVVKLYLPIYLDTSRSDRYPQKQFANFVVNEGLSEELLKSTIEEWLKEEYTRIDTMYAKVDPAFSVDTFNRLLRSTYKLMTFLDISDMDAYERFLKKLLERSV